MRNFEQALNKKGRRRNSVAVIGALFGDEGKGRITDELVEYFLKKKFKNVVVYRDNGGANAGHTIAFNGKRIGLHQIGSGILHNHCYVVLGKGMVIHPNDLLEEVDEIKEVFGFKDLPAKLMLDEMAVLSLDTHRAFEYALKNRDSKSLATKASTGRGIAPAYADVVYRFPLRVKDILSDSWKSNLSEHFKLYESLIGGLGYDIFDIPIQRYKGREYKIGSKERYIKEIGKIRDLLKAYVVDTLPFLRKHWRSTTPFIFEKAQAVGLDMRWGVYPDVSASNCCLDGITSSTAGVIDSNDISARFGVIKSTYMSSVGKRVLPTMMEEEVASTLRDDAHEYGTTTGRPRDIAYMDLVMLKYFCKRSGIEELVFTHMDIVYDYGVKVCINYKDRGGKPVEYRPDQEYINTVKPEYKTFKPWSIENLKRVKEYETVEGSAKTFVEYISNKSECTPVMLTYGPERNDSLYL